MSDIKWTKEQLSAITARKSKVLVNAAAGSGKTAVLTTRIIKRLIPENGETPVRADRLLVVTFTRAAAGEMRERIEKGLKDELAKAASCGDMKKRRFISNQIKQLAGAKICTIDSFCQSFIKEYFHILNIDPSFRIAQKSEENLIREEVFDRLTERLYKEKDSSFMILVSKCTRSGREDMVRDMVERLYDFTSNMPYPTEFIEKSAEEYLCRHGFYNTVWSDKLCEEGKERLAIFAEGFDRLAEVNENAAEITEDRERICEISQLTFKDALKAMRDFICKPIEGMSKFSAKMREELAEEIRALGEAIPEDTTELEEFLREVFYPEIKALADVAVKFISEMDEAKRVRSILTFSDIERMAYRLLAENDAIREEQKNRFDEILIDEYQDTNALQDGIFEMLSNGENLFMVGDMKQSIYRFRGSEPLVFRSKADSYSADTAAKMRKIMLTKNYRSRSEVLSSVNDLFANCMSRVVGELCYDEKEQLNLGNEGYEDTSFSYKSEFALLELDGTDDESLGRAEAEAEYIANRISEMKKSGFLVRDKDTTRSLKNSDIMILMSSHKADGKIFREVLSKYGIDCACDREGYFSRPEIKLIMSLLAAIENPERDIAMAAVMRSFIGGFSDDELARVRINGRKMSFYESLCDICSKYIALKAKGKLSAGGEIFGEKAAAFVGKINEWRDKARYMSAERLVNMLFEDAGFYAFFGAAGGEEAILNLELFFDRAKQYETSGYRGMFSFLQHMERLEKSGDDLEGASFAEGGDYVRIMTIHKSKGLEIPVVFLAGGGKRFNRIDAQGKLLMHQRLGFSLDYTDYNEGVLISSPIGGIFANTIRDELLSEEMRKLYVALTRAKEKLIVTACIKKDSKTEERLERWEALGAFGMQNEAKKANTFTDWLAPVAITSENWEFHFIRDMERGCAVEREEVVQEITLPNIDRVREMLTYTYPYAAKALKSKAAVSEFKGISHVDMAEKPKFLSDKHTSGTDFGTAVHKIMETLPRDRGTDREFIEEHIASLAASGDIPSELSGTFGADKIMKFFASELGKRFSAAKKVYSESEFEIGLDAGELYGDGELCGETVLLQGVIDCWFEEDDGIVLVDYKTDRVRNLDEIHQKYDIQLELYARALEKIAKKRVKEKFIYLFSLDSVVQC